MNFKVFLLGIDYMSFWIYNIDMMQRKNFNINNIRFYRYQSFSGDLAQVEIYGHYYEQELGRTLQICKILYTLENNVMTLNKIKVKADYQHLGIGSKLLEFMFEDCKKAKVKNIEGEFAPDDEAQGYAFYTKHGFEIREEVMADKLYKTLDFEDENE